MSQPIQYKTTSIINNKNKILEQRRTSGEKNLNILITILTAITTIFGVTSCIGI